MLTDLKVSFVSLIFLVKVIQTGSYGKVPIFSERGSDDILPIWAAVWGMETIDPYLGMANLDACDRVFSFTCDWFFCSHGVVTFSLPHFCSSEPQFPTSPTGCPRTRRVLNLNDEISLHAHIYHEKMSKIVPYWGSDDSVYPLELLIEHWGFIRWQLGVAITWMPVILLHATWGYLQPWHDRTFCAWS